LSLSRVTVVLRVIVESKEKRAHGGVLVRLGLWDAKDLEENRVMLVQRVLLERPALLGPQV
jgi:hypothetical protein